MKNYISIFLLFLSCIISTCEIPDLYWDLPKFPEVEIFLPQDILDISIKCSGNVTNDGGSPIVERGFCYSTNTNPTIENIKVICSGRLGYFETEITGLRANTTYYLCAYAKTKVGVAYGDEVVFTTAGLPSLTTNAVSSITRNTAICGGNITNDGGLSIIQKGVCYGTTPNPTILDDKVTSGLSNKSYTVSITGLIPGTKYYIRAYATNKAGTAYGNELSFTTPLFYIGQIYQGGIIFYVDGTGIHGLIAAQSDQSSGAIWGCSGTTLSNCNNSGIGYGLTNTNAIVTGCTSSGIAARLCYDFVLNEYSDWYLPSIDELSLMYTNLKTNGLGNFSNTYYWSSTQYSSTNSYLRSFSSGGVAYTSKNSLYRVRAIRKF